MAQTSSQTTKSGPWLPTQKHLKNALGAAENLFDKKKGFKAYGSGQPGVNAWNDYSSQTKDALGTMESLAKKPNPFFGGASNFTSGLIGGDYAHDQSGFNNLFGDAKNLSTGPSINTEGDFRSLFNSVDPEFENVVGRAANDVGDSVSRQFAGSSFGSAAHTGTLADQVGGVVSKMRSDNFNQNLANKTGILGNISGVQGQNFNNTMAGMGLQRGILGDQANLSQQDIQNQMGGLAAAPGVYDMQFQPAERMAQVGAAQDAKNNEILQAKMDKHNINQMSAWDRLMSYYGIASGTGQQGNRVTTNTSQPSNPLSSIIGGGVLASQIFG